MLCTRKPPFTLRRHHGNSKHVKSKASYVGLSLVPRIPEFQGVYTLVFAIGGYESLVVIGGYLGLRSKLLMPMEATESVVWIFWLWRIAGSRPNYGGCCAIFSLVLLLPEFSSIPFSSTAFQPGSPK
jgi:hypothetical protein